MSVALANGCGGEGDPASASAEGDGAAVALAMLAANPCDGTLTNRMDPADTTLARLLTGTIDLANEAHDCQRLVVSTGPGGEFGPLVGLFPVDGTLALARGDFTTPRPAVSVYSWGAAGGEHAAVYQPLELGPGAFCLWLRNPSGAAEDWSGALAPGLCGGPSVPPVEADFGLVVLERTYPEAVAEDYPRTARWEWDLDAERSFIGVRCGAAWCAVTTGSSAPRTRALPEQLRGYDLARLRIPGWSDAQHLPVFDSTAGRARPGPWGTLLSHPFLHDPDPLWTEGILVAAIDVRDDRSDAYQVMVEQWYLQPEDGGGRSDVILRFPGITPNEVWWQQGPMRRRQGATVTYTPAWARPATGAVRWRWREDGPDLWIFCRDGSCGVEG